MAIIKDRHARIIIVRPEITLHLEAGYIFAGCSRRNRFFLQFGGGPYILQQLLVSQVCKGEPRSAKKREAPFRIRLTEIEMAGFTRPYVAPYSPGRK